MSNGGQWKTTRAIFSEYCEGLGYSDVELNELVVGSDGEWIFVDIGNPFFPRLPKVLSHEVDSPPPSHGPGTELKVLLAGWPFYIVSSPTCKCNARARYMDEKGCDWCAGKEGMAEIMGFLREAAEERGLPFLDLPARLLVRRAIHNARRKESVADAEGSSHHDRRESLAPPGDAAQG
jgi:hypothetical protein